ncbi:hypothetical protein DFJ74DRAFT_707435 [Hyaloraphidium curvatum]|nr:hypothetical protein DFJ74DRAFT_707435 [Hyaloraphidium curvatum]
MRLAPAQALAAACLFAAGAYTRDRYGGGTRSPPPVAPDPAWPWAPPSCGARADGALAVPGGQAGVVSRAALGVARDPRGGAWEVYRVEEGRWTPPYDAGAGDKDDYLWRDHVKAKNVTLGRVHAGNLAERVLVHVEGLPREGEAVPEREAGTVALKGNDQRSELGTT